MVNTSKKIIASNRSALVALYGANNTLLIEGALNTLIGSDQRRQISTQIVWLDDAKQMTVLHAPVVTSPTDSKQNKQALDAVWKAIDPLYLTIVGGPDIVALQILDNPAGDSDPNVPSDLPYASSSPYSVKVADFVNASRLVGRIAGVTGLNDPTALLTALGEASSNIAADRSRYEKYWAVSAAVWQSSTTTSLKNTFGNATNLALSPPDGPNWIASQLQAMSHFVNCHGSSNDPNWYGQKASSYPVAVSAAQITGKLAKGVIAAAECCYGAQLYAPGAKQISLCNTYLASGAAAFCGSTNIAYGPAVGNGSADLICQYFIQNLLAGVSAGAAMLKARQTYVASHPTLSGVDLKTLAQFYLLGDSSIQPVVAPKQKTRPSLDGSGTVDNNPFERQQQQQAYLAFARGTAVQVSTAAVDDTITLSAEIEERVRNAARLMGVEPQKLQTGPVIYGPAARELMKDIVVPEHVHLVYDHSEPTKDRPFESSKVAVIHERAGEILSVEVLETKIQMEPA